MADILQPSVLNSGRKTFFPDARILPIADFPKCVLPVIQSSSLNFLFLRIMSKADCNSANSAIL
jgi:hypothetical protein